VIDQGVDSAPEDAELLPERLEFGVQLSNVRARRGSRTVGGDANSAPHNFGQLTTSSDREKIPVLAERPELIRGPEPRTRGHGDAEERVRRYH
jgi:hypothetical protein